MSTQVLQQQLDTNGQARFGSGWMFLLVAASGTVSVVATRQGSSASIRTFAGISAGFKFRADAQSDGFDFLTVTGTPGSSVTMAFGDDDIDFANAVTVGNTVTVEQLPAGTLANTAPVVTVAGQAALFPVNAARRRMTVFSDPANTVTVYLRTTGGANNIGFIQPGTSVEFDGTYGVDYSSAAAAQNLYLFEES